MDLYLADCRDVIPQLAGVDVVLADPPYSSGGFARSDRALPASKKYQMTTNLAFLPDFSGDNRDQLSLLIWASMWMSDLLPACRPGAVLGSFMDWRNLSVATNAVQVAGWVLRGISVWDKTEQVRPDKAWFRNQAEFIVWASAGALTRGPKAAGMCSPGVFRHRVDIANKEHMTQKPVELLREIIATRDDWQTVLDPFAGSGTTLVAARQLGRRAIGIEIEERWCEVAARRLESAKKESIEIEACAA